MKKLFVVLVVLVLAAFVGCQEERGTSASIAEDSFSGNGVPGDDDYCEPQCNYKQCGPDGCGGTCGDLNGDCPDGEICSATGKCVVGTGTKPDGEPAACVPNCTNKACGEDGCDGSCGACGNGKFCNSNWECETKPVGQPACTSVCTNKLCGNDGCGGSCGICGIGNVCNANYECVPEPISGCKVNCSNKDCGPDGCGGSCGKCGISFQCNNNWECEAVPPVCTPVCAGKECGTNGCGGLCGICLGTETCNAAGTCVANPVGPSWPQVLNFQLSGKIWIPDTGEEFQISCTDAPVVCTICDTDNVCTTGTGLTVGSPDTGSDGLVQVFVEIYSVPAVPDNGKIWSSKKFRHLPDGSDPLPPNCIKGTEGLTLGIPWEPPTDGLGLPNWPKSFWVISGCQ